MKPPNWDRIQEIYHAALERSPSERSQFVANACAGDPELLREVEELLAADGSSKEFLTPVVKLGSEEPGPSSEDDLVATTIADRYVVEKKLGAGGMGQVYFARDLRLNRRPIVIKILSSELLEESFAQQRFKKEVEALSRIHHDGVVKVLDTGALTDGRPYIVMEYVDGETLRSQIRAEGMNLQRAASILKQIGDALDHVHGQGVFHRDLKPENIMLKRGPDSVVLVDFGIAKVTNSIVAPSTAHGSPIGTLLYMSPEQLRDRGVTAASDIYSMALVAYEMVTGRRVFNASTVAQLLELQRKGVPVRPSSLRPNLSRKADEIIIRALSYKPQSRYQSAKEFGNDLAHTLSDSITAGNSTGRWKVVAVPLVVLIFVALLSVGLYKYCGVTPVSRPAYSFRYWLMVQEMRDGKEYRTLKTNGDGETFDNGDKFQLNVLTAQSGFLYIINEGPPEPNHTSFTMIFPNRTTNNGSASVGANQTIQSDWIAFRGPPGAENFWIVWSASPVDQLESAKSEALARPDGSLSDQTLITLKEFLKARQSESKPRTFRYKESQTVLVRDSAEMLVTLAQFNHR